MARCKPLNPPFTGSTQKEWSVQFRLTYDGPLLGSRSGREIEKSRIADKHLIRRKFHTQIKQLWENYPAMKEKTQSGHDGSGNRVPSVFEYFYGEQWCINGFHFAPLVYEGNHTYCKLEVLMLRYGLRGGVISNTDIDNRLKTLFDALSMPN